MHFLHVGDSSSALANIIKSQAQVETCILNIADDKVIEIRDLVQTIYKLCGADASVITTGPDRLFNDVNY